MKTEGETLFMAWGMIFVFMFALVMSLQVVALSRLDRLERNLQSIMQTLGMHPGDANCKKLPDRRSAEHPRYH